MPSASLPRLALFVFYVIYHSYSARNRTWSEVCINENGNTIVYLCHWFARTAKRDFSRAALLVQVVHTRWFKIPQPHDHTLMFNFSKNLVAFAWMPVSILAAFTPKSRNELQSAVGSCVKMSVPDTLTTAKTSHKSQEVFDLDGILTPFNSNFIFYCLLVLYLHCAYWAQHDDVFFIMACRLHMVAVSFLYIWEQSWSSPVRHVWNEQARNSECPAMLQWWKNRSN